VAALPPQLLLEEVSEGAVEAPSDPDLDDQPLGGGEALHGGALASDQALGLLEHLGDGLVGVHRVVVEEGE